MECIIVSATVMTGARNSSRFTFSNLRPPSLVNYKYSGGNADVGWSAATFPVLLLLLLLLNRQFEVRIVIPPTC